MLSIITYLLLFSLAGLALYSLREPGVATALVWLMIVLESVLQQGNAFLLAHSSFMNFLIAGIATFAAAAAFLRGDLRGSRSPKQVWWYALLIFYCISSVLWSVSPSDTREQLLINLPYVFAFGFLAPICIYNERQLTICLKVLIYFGALIMIGVLASKTGQRGILLEFAHGRDIEANPLAAASLASYVAFACLFSVLGKKLVTLESTLKLAIVILSLAVVIKSGSRGQLIAFAAISILLFPIFAKATARRSILLAGLAAISLTVVAIVMVDQLGWSHRWKLDSLVADQNSRWHMCEIMLQRYYDGGFFAWILGLGSSASFKYLQSYPHNMLVETLVEEGILGCSLLIAILYSFSQTGIRLITSTALPRDVRVDIATVLAIFSFNLLLSFKEGSLLGCAISLFSPGLVLVWLSQHFRYSPSRFAAANRLGHKRKLHGRIYQT